MLEAELNVGSLPTEYETYNKMKYLQRQLKGASPSS